jgi:tripartite-type tricarboxylate transporter receptor subunit TctC
MRLALGLLCLLPIMAASGALAQSYPSKPVRIIVPFGAGSTLDIMARVISPKLSEALGQQFIVENRPGAGGAIGLDATAKAPKDGYTLAIGATGPLAINPGLDPRLPWDPVRDFTPITQVALGPLILVTHAAVPARTLKELVALAKARPGKLTYGSPGIGSSNHLAGELLGITAGIKIVHVPYKGNAEALTDLLGGQIDMVITGVPPVLSHVQSGKLRAIVNTGPKRSPTMPQLPTVSESGLPGAEVNVWYGFVAPAGTPRDIVIRLNTAIVKIVGSPEISERFASLGAEPVTNTPEDFAKLVRNDVAKWAMVIKQQGIKLE